MAITFAIPNQIQKFQVQFKWNPKAKALRLNSKLITDIIIIIIIIIIIVIIIITINVLIIIINIIINIIIIIEITQIKQFVTHTIIS